MRTRLFSYAAITSMTALLMIAGCGDDELNPSSTSTTGTGGSGGTGGDGGSGGDMVTGNFVRVHYRLQDNGDVATWGVHFWGAGSESPMWGSPQLFTETDDFGAYTDVEITDTADSPDAWLGLIPVQCDGGGNCKKDVETGVRWVDLEKNAENAGIGECWITQGQAVQTMKPSTTGPAYKIYRAKDFIDLGDGRVRLMFRAAPGSTGAVDYGTASGSLTQKVTWAASDDVNKKGLVLSGLTPGQKVYYKISTSLMADGTELTDATPELDLTPIQFSTIDQAADWAAWGNSGVMYQLIVRTFADGGSPKNVADPGTESGIDTATQDGIGDLVGLRSMLPYLKDLGADAIWMTPVFKAHSYHGYDTTDFYDIDPSVGTRKDFADLTEAAHQLGIKIILDLVQNHVADVNPWFISGINPKDADYDKYHDWFVWSDEYSNMYTDPHPWDPSAVIWACKNYMCYHQIFGASLPELNYHNPAVRAEMKSISQYWIDLGADGFRLDASKHIDQFDDINGITIEEHGTHVWWKEFNHYVKKEVVRPAGSATVLLAGENRWDDPAVANYMVPYAGDMDSQFDFPFRSLVSNFINGMSGDDVDFVKYLKLLRQKTSVPSNGGNVNHFFQRFLSNHDLERPATQFEGAAGAQLNAVLKQLATIVMTVPGMPVIYYGEEVGKKGKRDKYVGNEQWDHDEHIREPMSWFQDVTFSGDMMASYDIDYAATNQANAAVSLAAGVCKAPNPDYPYIKFMTEMDSASWAAQKDDTNSLYNYYKQLVAIRKAHPAMTAQNAQLTTVQNTADAYEYTLSDGVESLTVILNRKSTPQTFTRPTQVTDLITQVSSTSFDVPAYGAVILQ